jgi:hypothetical protein
MKHWQEDTAQRYGYQLSFEDRFSFQFCGERKNDYLYESISNFTVSNRARSLIISSHAIASDSDLEASVHEVYDGIDFDTNKGEHVTKLEEKHGKKTSFTISAESTVPL